MPRFKIEQIALAPHNSDGGAAMWLLRDLGITEWVEDDVIADVKMLRERPVEGSQNKAHLAFNYTGLAEARELEVLQYKPASPNWLAGKTPRASHFGMHCTEEELEEWRAFFERRGIGIAQEVETVEHTNPVIAGKRRYRYVVFDTAWIIGVDLKFIVRILTPEPAEEGWDGDVEKVRTYDPPGRTTWDPQDVNNDGVLDIAQSIPSFGEPS